MKLQTNVPIQKKSENLIDYTSKIVLLGSCFSENIGSKFAEFQFQIAQNPFGILFHPKAIEALISRTLNYHLFSDEDLIYNNEMYHLFDVHSSLSNANKDIVLTNANSAVNTTKTFIKNASHIIITLGTGWVYKHIKRDKIVANCHKIPQREFEKQLLSVTEISESLQRSMDTILAVNNNVKFIFTVSPVRHLKDGFTENSLSKAHLLSSIHHVISNNKNIASYFPSFEIVLDELRDYRFYKEDLLHPNQTAINYIWEKFTDAWLDSSTHKTMQKVDEINKGLTHKPFNEHSEAHQHFLKKLAQKQLSIVTEFPFMKW